jgi:hypothetical protein
MVSGLVANTAGQCRMPMIPLWSNGSAINSSPTRLFALSEFCPAGGWLPPGIAALIDAPLDQSSKREIRGAFRETCCQSRFQ